MEALASFRVFTRAGWIPRATGALLAVVAAPLPGLAHALRGRPGAWWASAAAALIVVGTGLAGVAVRCICPFVAGAALYGALAFAAAAHAARGSGALALRPAVFAAALPVLSLLAVRAWIVDLYFVPTDSMAPTIRAGDYILVSRIGGPPRRGDVVVFRDASGRLFVKRVTAVPGDRVAVDRGEVVVNGVREPLQLEPGVRGAARYYTETGGRPHRVLFREPWGARASYPERVVPRGLLFVMGDHRDRSEDSRQRGFVPVEAVVGRAFSVGPGRSPSGAWRWDRAGALL